ncbi:MAG: ABC transporter substrate-binding protein, partial [Acidobacteriota bacterium]
APQPGRPSYEAFGELIFDFYTQRRSSTSVENPRLPDLAELAPELLRAFPTLGEIPELANAAGGAPSARGARPAVLSAANSVLPAGEENRGDQRSMFELLARALSLLAGKRPLGLILDRLEAAETSVELILYLLRRLGPTRTFMLATYRPSATAPDHPLRRMVRGLEGDPRCLHVVLEPLEESCHAELLEHLLGGGVEASTSKALFEITEGNPLFAEETVRALWDSGDLSLGEVGGWRLSDPKALRQRLPASIQQAVSLRVERLESGPLEALGIASVLGRRFRYGDLERLSDAGDELDDHVDVLINRGLLEEVPRTRGEQLFLTSGLVRDVVYGALPGRRRRRLHRSDARILEPRLHQPRGPALAALLLHFAEGDVPEKAVHYGTLQAEQALERNGFEDVIAACTTAIGFLATPDMPGQMGLYEGRLRLLLAKALTGRGRSDRALREAARAVDSFQQRGESGLAAQAVASLVAIAWKERRMEEVGRWLETGIALARAAALPETLAELLRLAATAANLRGEHARAKHFLAEIEASENPEGGDASGAEILGDRELRIGMRGEVSTLDPAVASTVQEAELLGSVFEPLVEVGPEGRIVPRLARSLSAASEDLRELRVQLREGLTFSDGAPLDARAVKTSLEQAGRLGAHRLRSFLDHFEGGSSFVEGESREIAGIRVEAPLELSLRLVDPAPLLPAMLSTLGLSIARRHGGQVYGTGPFRLTEWTSRSWKLERLDADCSRVKPRA